MNSSTLYTYTSGALFEQPNSYMYPPILGRAFLVDYESNRYAALQVLLKRAADLNLQERSFIGSALNRYSGAPLSSEFRQLGAGGNGDFSQLWTERPDYLSQICDQGVANTKRLLQALLATSVNPSVLLNSEYPLVLRQLLRNFEVRRVLFKSYESKLRKGVEIVVEPELYAQLGFLAGLELDSSPSLQITNVLLKINDSLIHSHAGLLTPINCALGAISIGCEMSQIRSLMMARGIA